MFRNPTIGADPELFVFDKRKKNFVTAEGLISGTKQHPHSVYAGMQRGRMQVDGVAAEFNTDVFQLGQRSVKFVNNVVAIRKHVENLAQNKNRHVELVAVPTADFDPEYFKTLSEESRELGCDPDYSGYDGMANRRPDGEVTYRTGSGHVHVGWNITDDLARKGQYQWDPGDNDHYERCMAMAVELDYYLGIPSLLWDNDNRRRSLYGKAGAFRPKTYGMEYRVLSNVWVGNEKFIGYVYDQTNLCVQTFDTMKYFDKYGGLAADIINNNDIEQAKSWMKDVGMAFPEV